MIFRDLKQNYSIYILDKDQLAVTTAKVTEVGLPRYDVNVKQTVVDVKVEYEGKVGGYILPETMSISSNGNIVISTDMEGLSREVEAMKNTAERIIASIPHQEEIIKKASSLLTELNPTYRKDKEIEDRFNKIETSVTDIKKLLTDIFTEVKGGSK